MKKEKFKLNKKRAFKFQKDIYIQTTDEMISYGERNMNVVKIDKICIQEEGSHCFHYVPQSDHSLGYGPYWNMEGSSFKFEEGKIYRIRLFVDELTVKGE